MRHFTSDWFTKYADEWIDRLGHLSIVPISFLEIGSYEGRSTCWVLDNILKHKESFITCIDPWDGNDPCLELKTLGAYDRFKNNISQYKNKVIYYQQDSKTALTQLIAAGRAYNAIFVDGNHEGHNALVDIVLSWELLENNGWLIVDDYNWVNDNLRTFPKDAWDAFVSVKPLGLKWEVAGRLVFAQKIIP